MGVVYFEIPDIVDGGILEFSKSSLFAQGFSKFADSGWCGCIFEKIRDIFCMYPVSDL
jgi:hypothetical protein